MAEREFNVQVMETKAQWESGLRSRLSLDGNGLSLFVNPAFDSWLVTDCWQNGAGDIVVDECGQTYWTAIERQPRGGRVWTLLRHNPTTGEIERVLTFAGCGRIEPRKLWLSSDYFWILDQPESDNPGRKNRMLALSRQNSQIIHEFTLDDLIDLDLDKRGFFYSLINHQGHLKLCRHSIAPVQLDQPECEGRKQWKPTVRNQWGPEGSKECFALQQWQDPKALAVGRQGIVYLLDVGLGRFIRFNPETKEETLLGALQEKLLKGFKPSVMEIDERGVIFLASKPEIGKPAELHMFDEDGSYLGQVELPSSVVKIDGIGFDGHGGVYLATNRGLARFSLSKAPVGQDGVFYAPTLDNGAPQNRWHRIALKGLIPSKSSVEVFYYSSDDETLKTAYDAVLASTDSVEAKVAKVEQLLSPRWIGAETFNGADFADANADPQNSKSEELASPDLLLDPNSGRFLWLKIRLITFAPKVRPTVSSLRIYYPRLSYLRYLPPVYRDEKISAAFLERFLSLFETVFDGLDQEIDQLFSHFDPYLAPKDFLPWLSSWINLSLDDDLHEDRVRRFIQRAPYLYNRKGTPGALVEFLEIYTGRPVFLTEHSRGLKPLVLGGADFKLGQGTILLGSGPPGMRVGDTTVVGGAALRDRVADADEPFLPLARRFTIVIDMDRDEFRRQEATLKRIIAEQRPAHTTCTIGLVAGQDSVGKAVLGISVKASDTRPYRVGETPLGTGSVIAKGPRALRIERGAWVGSLKRL